MIKKCIEYLIDKSFLERNPDSPDEYNYLAWWRHLMSRQLLFPPAKALCRRFRPPALRDVTGLGVVALVHSTRSLTAACRKGTAWLVLCICRSSCNVLPPSMRPFIFCLCVFDNSLSPIYDCYVTSHIIALCHCWNRQGPCIRVASINVCVLKIVVLNDSTRVAFRLVTWILNYTE